MFLEENTIYRCERVEARREGFVSEACDVSGEHKSSSCDIKNSMKISSELSN